jgi:hypothetical protein
MMRRGGPRSTPGQVQHSGVAWRIGDDGGCNMVVSGLWEIDMPSRKQRAHKVHREEEDITSVWTTWKSFRWRGVMKVRQSWRRWPGRRPFVLIPARIWRKKGRRRKRSCCADRSCLGRLGISVTARRCPRPPLCARAACGPPTSASTSVHDVAPPQPKSSPRQAAPLAPPHASMHAP